MLYLLLFSAFCCMHIGNRRRAACAEVCRKFDLTGWVSSKMTVLLRFYPALQC